MTCDPTCDSSPPSAGRWRTPRLEAFLRRWEQLTGQPINEWESLIHRGAYIHRYGFLPMPPHD